jgi:hypothetical protein
MSNLTIDLNEKEIIRTAKKLDAEKHLCYNRNVIQ